MITIQHSYTDGTTVGGTVRGDSAHEILADADQWRWWRTYDAWGLRDSHQRLPKWARIGRLAAALREAGYTVEIKLDETMPPMQQREADFVAKAAGRAAALYDKAGRQQARGDAREDAACALTDGIPLGQPLLPGHHSYNREVRRYERVDGHLRAAVQHRTDARATASRASAAETRGALYAAPLAVAARIEALEPEERALVRDLAGEPASWHQDAEGHTWFGVSPPTGERRRRLERTLTDVREQLEHWRARRAEHLASGAAFDPDSVSVGDWIPAGPHHWMPVRKVNVKSFRVPDALGTRCDDRGRERTGTIPKHKINRKRSAKEIPEWLRALYAQPGTNTEGAQQ